MKRKFQLPGLLSAAAFAVGLAVAPAAQSTTLSNFLTFDGPVHNALIAGTPFQGGGEDKLQDDSISVYIPASPTQQGYAQGDVIWGMITLSEILASGRSSVGIGANSQIMILFSAQIQSLTGAAGGKIQLVPSTTVSLSSLCGAVCSGAGIDANTMAVVLSTTQADNALAGGAADPLNWTAAGATANINGAGGRGPWSWEATLGLIAGTDDFFAFNPNGPSQLDGTERGVFSVQSSAFDVKDWLPVDVLDFGGTVRYGDVTLNVGTVGIAEANEIARGWTFTDQSTFYINPVPEPASIALLGIALAGLGGMARRTRKQN